MTSPPIPLSSIVWLDLTPDEVVKTKSPPFNFFFWTIEALKKTRRLDFEIMEIFVKTGLLFKYLNNTVMYPGVTEKPRIKPSLRKTTRISKINFEYFILVFNLWVFCAFCIWEKLFSSERNIIKTLPTGFCNTW